MNKLQLKHRELKIISVIAASENISHAATVLGIAQANVSKYLADFESKVAPDKSVQSDLQDGTLVPCFPEQNEWWLDLVAIFRKREYQPWRVQYVLDEMLREIRNQLAQAHLLRPEQASVNEN